MIVMARGGIVQGVKDNDFPTLSFLFFILKFLITPRPRVFFAYFGLKARVPFH
jgi:hypothetical protein